MSKDKKNDIAEPASFEEALARIEGLVKELEEGDVPLEKALAAFEEGQVLIRFCETKLKAAEQTLKQINRDAPETPTESN
jgi:exodeoxyribonuclease VII small subunit